MDTLFALPDDLQSGYARVYEGLSRLREAFHRTGRLDDSNAKLDEVSKLFAAYLSFRNGQIDGFPNHGSPNLIAALQTAFEATARLPQYQVGDGNSIFGARPALATRPGDEALASELIRVVRESIDLAFDLKAAGHPFDILNEAFGHFVRDNFRSNIEDAQYMTPPEVVDFMVDTVLSDVATEAKRTRRGRPHITVLDPTCGVGSFLTAVYHRAGTGSGVDRDHLRLFGQDKVERMVRLSTINLELFDVERHRVTLGNSLELGSPIDDLNGVVDIILTNPPFGARFSQDYVTNACGGNIPFFSSLRRTTASLDSELLFVDRNLRLLRDGGHLLMVVPDGVVSAKGIAGLLRQHLAGVATIQAVVELPSVAFAQAGTRTRTAILYLRKGRSTDPAHTFMAVSRDLGFQVASRKGVQVKIPQGTNDLPVILSKYREGVRLPSVTAAQVLNSEPSCVLLPSDEVTRGSWTPNHYSATRLSTVASLAGRREIDLLPLGDLVQFCADERRAEPWQSGWAFISVLHILGEGLLDIGGMLAYAPKTPGINTSPGELLLSRINPRIPRVCVTPDLGTRTLCSSEFEVMLVGQKIDAYALAYLLQTKAVQSQIQSLTSGTSASHNRVRTSELAKVMIPTPLAGSSQSARLEAQMADYRRALAAVSKAVRIIAEIRACEGQVIPHPS
jgi:predicted RNA methylase